MTRRKPTAALAAGAAIDTASVQTGAASFDAMKAALSGDAQDGQPKFEVLVFPPGWTHGQPRRVTDPDIPAALLEESGRAVDAARALFGTTRDLALAMIGLTRSIQAWLRASDGGPPDLTPEAAAEGVKRGGVLAMAYGDEFAHFAPLDVLRTDLDERIAERAFAEHDAIQLVIGRLWANGVLERCITGDDAQDHATLLERIRGARLSQPPLLLRGLELASASQLFALLRVRATVARCLQAMESDGHLAYKTERQRRAAFRPGIDKRLKAPKIKTASEERRVRDQIVEDLIRAEYVAHPTGGNLQRLLKKLREEHGISIERGTFYRIGREAGLIGSGAPSRRHSPVMKIW